MRYPDQPAYDLVIVRKRVDMLKDTDILRRIFKVNRIVLVIEIRLKLFNKVVVIVDCRDVVR